MKILTILITAAMLCTSLVWAETKSYTVSVVIPQIVGVNFFPNQDNQQITNNNRSVYTQSSQLISENEEMQGNQLVTIRTIVAK
ncbi:MAG: hypothetical protein HQL25_06390 [Candidatus Omnitrophica bacterium]|nr:hypothetical protein [Candidatus Omnitrophota bacterium]